MAVLTLVLLAAVWGLVYGVLAPFGPGDPGIESALSAAFLVLLVMGLPGALLGFLVGACVALLIGTDSTTG